MPFIFLSAAWGVTTSASYKKKIISPKNNFGFKCPLQRGWNNLSWTLRRQKKVIAWVSHYLQQGGSGGVITDLGKAVQNISCSWLCRRGGQRAHSLLWAIHILSRIVSIPHALYPLVCSLTILHSCGFTLPLISALSAMRITCLNN